MFVGENWTSVGCLVCTTETTAADPCSSPVGVTTHYFEVQIPLRITCCFGRYGLRCDARGPLSAKKLALEVRRGTALKWKT